LRHLARESDIGRLAWGGARAYCAAMAQTHDRLLIIDFGSQVTQLIARRLRELRVYCEIHPFQKVTDAFLRDFAPKAVILSGGPASVFEPGAPMPPPSVFTLGVPVLGICYGQQVMMHCLGGKVERGHGTAEFGRAMVTPAGGPLDLLEGWFAAGPEQVRAEAPELRELEQKLRAAYMNQERRRQLEEKAVLDNQVLLLGPMNAFHPCTQQPLQY